MKKIFLAVMMAVCSAFTFTAAPTMAEAAEAVVGYVDLNAVFAAYPGMEAAQKELQDTQADLQKQFNDQSADLDDHGKADLQNQLNQKLIKKQQEIMEPIQKKISEAIKKAAKDKGVAQVIKADSILYGGVDLTKDAIVDIPKE